MVGGGGSGSGKFGRSRESGRMSWASDHGRPQTSSQKEGTDVDLKLKDDGISPAKRVERAMGELGVKPKCLAFGEVAGGAEPTVAVGKG